MIVRDRGKQAHLGHNQVCPTIGSCPWRSKRLKETVMNDRPEAAAPPSAVAAVVPPDIVLLATTLAGNALHLIW